ncbi:immunity 49 family protein [Streptomyces sp. 900116325]
MAAEFPTWEAWVTAMQVGSALFISGTAAEGPVPCRIGGTGEVKNLPATGPQDYLHAGDWLTSFYLATICRENERLNQLAQVLISSLRESGAEFDEYIYAWVETLQNAWFRRREAWDTLVTAVNGTAPESAQVAGKELMLKILYPPLELFHRYQRQDAEKFNAALVDALTDLRNSRTLSGECDYTPPGSVDPDRRSRQVLWNKLVEAAKALPRNGPSHRHAAVTARRNPLINLFDRYQR